MQPFILRKTMESSAYSTFFGTPDYSNTTYAPSDADTEGLDADQIIAISISAGFGAIVLFLICCCCCSAGFASWVDSVINSSSNGDEVYADIALRRMREEEEKKKEDPSVRKEKLLASFDRNKVSMVITQDSYVQKKVDKEKHDKEDPTASESTLSETIHSSSDEEDEDEGNKRTVSIILDDLESNEPNEIYLNSTRKSKLTGKEARVKVANSCAICLCSYDIDDVVVWSSNEDCTHAFHDECILAWLVKNQNGECPCCRCPFTDLPPPDGAKKEKSWSFRAWRMRYNSVGQRDATTASDPDGQVQNESELV